MPSATYRLFEQAMRERSPLACMYQGYRRAVCPIVLGHTDGEEKSLTWQFGGSGSKGPVHGQWRCLTLAEVSDVQLTNGPWQTSSDSHMASQSCVKDVDLDMNPDSPYGPKRRL